MEKIKENGKKSTLTERVLQFGEGNFLRGFVDWMIDKLNKENGGDYGVTIVQPLAGGLVDKLNAQDGRYSLYLRGLLKGEKVEETRIVDCVTRGINPYINTDEFFDCAKKIPTCVLSFQTLQRPVSNTNLIKIPDDFNGLTFPGRLTLFMKKRFDEGLGGFITSSV